MVLLKDATTSTKAICIHLHSTRVELVLSLASHYIADIICLQSALLLLLLPHARWLSDHDVQRDVPASSLQVDLPRLLKPKLPVDRRVSRITRLQVTRPALAIRDSGHMFNELAGVALSTTTGPGAYVNEVPGLELSLTERSMHCVVEERQEFIEETALAFGGEAVVEAPHTRAEYG